MLRRDFLKTGIAAGAAGATGQALAQSASPAREYYQLRRYSLTSGAGAKVCAEYFAHSLIPALNRMGVPRVGAFSLDFGPETPTVYLLIPGPDLTQLVDLHAALQKDETFMKTAAPFWSAPSAAPVYQRVESQLLRSFAGWPKLTPPPTGKRIFQLRTYESPSDAAHVRKIEMFHSGEFEVFARSGAKQVFYGDTLIGPRTPNLTYMLSFADYAELDAVWTRFRSDPQWKKLSAEPRFSAEPIVTNISNLVLRPTDYSQI